MFYFLPCMAGCSLILAVWIPWRARYKLTVLRATATVLILGVTALGVDVLHQLRGFDALAGSPPSPSRASHADTRFEHRGRRHRLADAPRTASRSCRAEEEDRMYRMGIDPVSLDLIRIPDSEPPEREEMEGGVHDDCTVSYARSPIPLWSPPIRIER